MQGCMLVSCKSTGAVWCVCVCGVCVCVCGVCNPSLPPLSVASVCLSLACMCVCVRALSSGACVCVSSRACAANGQVKSTKRLVFVDKRLVERACSTGHPQLEHVIALITGLKKAKKTSRAAQSVSVSPSTYSVCFNLLTLAA